MNGDMEPSDKTEQRYSLTVDAARHGERLDVFLAKSLQTEGFSRERVKALVRAGCVVVDEKPVLSPKATLRTGNLVALCAVSSCSSLTAEPGELEVLYRDAALAVINKPAGITTHPAPGLKEGTLAHRLLSHFPELAKQEGERPGIVHRLDKGTSGLMIVALTEECRLALAAMFAAHTVRKEYLALVKGVPQKAEGTIKAPIGRHPVKKTRMAVSPGGKEAKSAWRTLYADPAGRFALLAVRIFSGRTHQVRVHMAHLGHPLLGDAVYGNKDDPLLTRNFFALGGKKDQTISATAGSESQKIPSFSDKHDLTGYCPPDETAARQERTSVRQMLHAWKLGFAHPLPNEAAPPFAGELPPPDKGYGVALDFCCLPPDFLDAARLLCRSGLRVVITGSPGCGKSELLFHIRQRGIHVFSADAFVADMFKPGNDGHRLLSIHYGERFVPDPTAPVDKAALAAAMRGSESVRREVESLLHPIVFAALQTFWQEHEQADLAVAEVPLYLECGNTEQTPAHERPVLVGVRCPFEKRHKRLTQNRGWPDALIADVESWQWPENKKMAACDLIVDNDSSLESLKCSVEKLLCDLDSLRRARDEETVAVIASCWQCPK